MTITAPSSVRLALQIAFVIIVVVSSGFFIMTVNTSIRSTKRTISFAISSDSSLAEPTFSRRTSLRFFFFFHLLFLFLDKDLRNARWLTRRI